MEIINGFEVYSRIHGTVFLSDDRTRFQTASAADLAQSRARLDGLAAQGLYREEDVNGDGSVTRCVEILPNGTEQVTTIRRGAGCAVVEL